MALASIFFLRNEEGADRTLLYFAITICVSSDIGGYVFGKIFKWKKLTSISPKKTISGVFGSYFFSLVCYFVFVEHLNFVLNFSITEISFIDGVFFTIILSTIAQVGDLIISYFKRIEKIKDTGKILPGHGGIFDRIDGLMFVVIFAYLINYFNSL